jgi:hypothetical protein
LALDKTSQVLFSPGVFSAAHHLLQSVELFLGLNVAQHFPGLALVHPAPPDLQGPDPDDVHEGARAADGTPAGPAGLNGSMVRREGSSVLEALPPEPWLGGLSDGASDAAVAPQGAARGGGFVEVTGGWSDDAGAAEDGSVALDPLGAVRTPLRAAQRSSSGDGGGAAVARGGGAAPAPPAARFSDLLL